MEVEFGIVECKASIIDVFKQNHFYAIIMKSNSRGTVLARAENGSLIELECQEITNGMFYWKVFQSCAELQAGEPITEFWIYKTFQFAELFLDYFDKQLSSED